MYWTYAEWTEGFRRLLDFLQLNEVLFVVDGIVGEQVEIGIKKLAWGRSRGEIYQMNQIVQCSVQFSMVSSTDF